MKRRILVFALLCGFCASLIGCGGGGSQTVFEKVSLHMTMDEVEAALGTPDRREDTKFYYDNVPLGSLSGTVEVYFTRDSLLLYDVDWWFDTGDKTPQDYAKEMEEIYTLFTQKYGEAELYEDREGVYCWHQYESGGTQFLLFSKYDRQICLYAEYD